MSKPMHAHNWTEGEMEQLLRAAVMDDDVWGYCTICGEEIYPVEPDATDAWCENCSALVPIDGLECLGYI